MKRLFVLILMSLMLAGGTASAVNRHTIISPLANATAQAMIVTAEGGADHTDVVFTNVSTTIDTSFNLDACQQPAVNVPADSAVNFHDVGNWTCNSALYFKLTALPPNVAALSVVTIGTSTFEVPPLHAIDSAHTSVIGRYPQTALVNEEPVLSNLDHRWYLGAGTDYSSPSFDTAALAQVRAQEVYITTFGNGNVTVIVHGPAGKPLVNESYDTRNFRVRDGVSQYKLKTKFLTGWIEVTTNDSQLYGLVTVATFTNALSRSYPF